MKKTLLSLVMLTALVAFGATQAEAQSGSVAVTVTITEVLAITVAPDWAIGSVSESATAISGADYFTVTNTSNATCDLTTTVDATTGEGWSFAVNPGADAFAMDHSIDQGTTWTQIELAGTILVSGLAAQTNQSFDLQFYAPLTTTVGGTPQSFNVTITAG